MNQAEHKIATLCRVLGVSTSGCRVGGGAP